MASKMTYDKVRSRMVTVRDRFLRDPYGATPKQIRMAEDPGVFSFLCRFYWFMYKVGNGNAESIQRTDYKDLLWTISDRESRAYMLEQLSYDGSASAGKMASDLKALGKKYGGRRACPGMRYTRSGTTAARWPKPPASARCARCSGGTAPARSTASTRAVPRPIWAP